MTSLTRTIEIDDITPDELAELFAGMYGDQQARFFARVGEIADTWPGAGWCQQCCSISEHLDAKATETILKLGEWAADPYPAAQAIEARRAATGTGAVHESPVGNADAPKVQSHD